MAACGNCGQLSCTCYFENGCASNEELGEDALTWYVALDGFPATRVSTPDSVALSQTGDITLEAQIIALDYTTATAQNIIAKWNETGNQRSYRLQINTSGGLSFSWSTDGTTVLTRNSTVPLPFTDGQKVWVSGRLDVDDTGGSHLVNFFTSTDGVTFTLLGATVTTAGVTSVFDSTADVVIGSQNDGVVVPNHLNGRVYRAFINIPLVDGPFHNVAVQLLADFDPEDASGKVANTQVPPTFESKLGEDWTLAGNARWNFDPFSFCAVVTGNGRDYAPINFRPNNVPLPRPYAYVTRRTVQTFAASTVDPIIWLESKTPGAESMLIVVPTDRLTVPVDGYYMVTTQITIGASPSSTGNDTVILRKNGTTNMALFTGVVNGSRSINVIEKLVAGDFIQVLISTAAGGVTDVSPSDGIGFDATYPYLWAQWMRPL